MTVVVISSSGTSGPRGNGWLHGVGAPSDAAGFDGDFYLDNTNPDAPVYYGPKTLGTWSGQGPYNFGVGTGSVASVESGDQSIVVNNTDPTNPTIESGTLDRVANLHPPASNWGNSGHKITSVAAGTTTGDVATFEQIPSIPSSLPPSGTASGDLSGNYPNPTVGKVNGTVFPASPGAGTIPVANGSGAVVWTTPAAVPGAASTVTTQTAYGAASATGSDTTYAREDHAHGTPALSTTPPPTTLAIGTAASAGTASTPPKADHVHPMAAAGAPHASAVGDAQTTGTATTFAASDHVHAREGFGVVSAQTSFGASSSNGSATTVPHSDHTHGTPTYPAVWIPPDNNLLWANYNPENAGTSVDPPNATVAGKLTLHRMMIRQTVTMTNVLFGLSAIDGTGPISNSYIGVYDSTGTLQAQTADISAVLMSSATGKTVAFTAPYANAPAGEYFLALLLNGTWSTQLQFKSSGGGATTNLGLATPHLVLSNLGTGLTTLPATISLASQTTTLITGGWGSQWYGVS